LSSANGVRQILILQGGIKMGSSVNAYQTDRAFQCAKCEKENEDVSCWVEGDEVTHVCEHCGYEDTVNL